MPDDSEIQQVLFRHFQSTGALLHGHFILRSGLRSREYFQCALLLQETRIAEEVCGYLAAKASACEFETVISPAVGGLIVGQEVARQLGKRHIFAEKDDTGALVLRRGFAIRQGERFFVAEDVVTRGGRVLETMAIVRGHGGVVAGAGAIVDRGGNSLPDFGCPFFGLVRLEIETFETDALPADLLRIPPVKPGSK